MFVFLNLLVSVYPRDPHVGRLPIRHKPKPEDFEFLTDVRRDLDKLPERCAMFLRILWWKNIALQMAHVASMLTLDVATLQVFVARA